MSAIALCFLTRGSHNQQKLWYNYLDNVPSSDFNVYCHNKSRFSYDDYFLRLHEIPKKIDTAWADISLVRATLELFREAYKDESNDFFVLLSESCIPLHKFSFIRKDIYTKNSNLLNIPANWNALEKCNWNRPRRWGKAKHFCKTPDNFKKASQWLCLTRSTVKFFLENDYTALFKSVWAVDEHYFATLIHMHNLGFKNHPVTFASWKHQVNLPLGSNAHPKTYTQLGVTDINSARDHYFMRKIDKNCVISKEIESIILSNP